MSQVQIETQEYLQIRAVKKLYGKRVKKIDLVEEIIRLRKQEDIREVIPLSYGEIAKIMNMSRTHIMRYKKMAVKPGMIQINENGKEIISDNLKNLKEFQILSKNFFAKKPIVKE
jgi:DNA-binding transcriptional regulator LsrR (DeoR family)